ncbi:uncharacterized protein LOC119992818 [Tripterygium wilfordii]|uniref:uncharacterized protein LOC119992818 n=1 Tax=Tripterygium wilfordii TaxID=458696 RepID=UPI0018F8079E|nr:uncharacterized protein LOC119992818 [Tripterygium wilfordii]
MSLNETIVRAFPTCEALHRNLGASKNEQGLAPACLHTLALHRTLDVVINEQGHARVFPVSNEPHWRPDVVRNGQGFPRFGRSRVKKLVHNHNHRIRIGTWNIGSLTGRLTELVDTMTRRIVIDSELKDNVVEIKQTSDMILLAKLLLGEEIVNVISAYTPQIGLDENIKKQFWENLDAIIQGIPIREKIFLGGDLNGHIGRDSENFDSVHGGYGFGDRNEVG